ncbi:MAG: TonB-dependent receptor plug domain-containing protein, partial [Taibaiella sp.]|nr:TonB-dependent receptor plug domain-containing protein [Taibaiella sp.]
MIDVVMLEDVKSLDEVIVNAGYYTTTKTTQTSNIGRVEAKDIQSQPVSNPIAALQGRIPGLEIVQQTGVPGGNFQVRIRGQNSIGNGNDPLYIIDGVPYTSTPQASSETSDEIFPGGLGTSPLNYINPFDIESIEILKDADATSLYGSRGANGVILITTRKGEKGGKTRVNLNYAEGVGRVARKMQLLNTGEYLSMRNEAFSNDGITPTEGNAPDLLLWDSDRSTDWQEELIGGNSRYRNAQLSLSGGENNTFVSAGMGYHQETLVFPGSNSDQRLSAHLTAKNTSANQRLNTIVTVNYALNNTDFIKRDLTREALILSPNAPPLLDADGTL